MKIEKIIAAFLFLSAFVLSGFAQTDLNHALGNPSNAAADVQQPNNYLVAHRGYTLAYNKDRGGANWVAWHLQKSDIGTVERTNDFAPDTFLSADWWIKPLDYSGTGYDRGHMCPSKDRSDTEENNRETFLMSNMQPQSPKLNQKTWKYLEDYTRETVGKGNEAYIYAGCYGNKGTIRSKITVPERCFKIIAVLPVGEDDLKRVDINTRIIAADMPNDDSVSIRWRTYLTTVDDIEAKTGFDFLSNVSNEIQKIIEAKTDTESTTGKDPDETKPPPADNDTGDRKYFLGSRGGCYYLTASGRKTYVDRNLCDGITKSSDAGKTDKKEEKTESTKKSDPEERKYFKGSRGGCYYLTASGAKKYVDRSLCEDGAPDKAEPPEKNKEEKPPENTGDRKYFKGSRGGCYYLSPSGRKVYVDRSLCN